MGANSGGPAMKGTFQPNQAARKDGQCQAYEYGAEVTGKGFCHLLGFSTLSVVLDN